MSLDGMTGAGNQSRKRRELIAKLCEGFPEARSRQFSQREWCRAIGLRLRMGLCAGLVQVWWRERRCGRDPFKLLIDCGGTVVAEVFLSQARSVYLVRMPSSEGDLSETAAELLRFKFGSCNMSDIAALCHLFDVESALGLDLVLQHEANIVAQSGFRNIGPDVCDALVGMHAPGLRLLITRGDKKQPQGLRGHRSALIVDPKGSYCYFDPSFGEFCFSRPQDFCAWLQECWRACGPGVVPLPPRSGYPVEVVQFGEPLTGNCRNIALSLRRSIWSWPLDKAVRLIAAGARKPVIRPPNVRGSDPVQ